MVFRGASRVSWSLVSSLVRPTHHAPPVQRRMEQFRFAYKKSQIALWASKMPRDLVYDMESFYQDLYLFET